MNKEKIILIGGGGHCKSCIEVIESEGRFQIAGIIDHKDKLGDKLLSYPYIGCDDDLPELRKKYDYALVTVGQIKSANLRKKLYNLLKDLQYNLPAIVASSAYVSKNAYIGEGSIIMHQAFVNADVQIGVNNIINSKALIEHDVVVGNHNHISTGAKLNGSVQVGNECFIGSNTTFVNDIKIGNNIFIGLSAIVNKNIKEKGVYVGNPIRKIR